MADAFTFDTSGSVTFIAVLTPVALDQTPGKLDYRWSDLTPFQQGYVEAAFATVGGLYWAGAKRGEAMARGFRHLHPSTLAQILKDCEAFTEWAQRVCGVDYYRSAHDGCWFWEARQRGQFPDDPAFPPLTLYLSDDGRIHMKERES